MTRRCESERDLEPCSDLISQVACVRVHLSEGGGRDSLASKGAVTSTADARFVVVAIAAAAAVRQPLETSRPATSAAAKAVLGHVAHAGPPHPRAPPSRRIRSRPRRAITVRAAHRWDGTAAAGVEYERSCRPSLLTTPSPFEGPFAPHSKM